MALTTASRSSGRHCSSCGREIGSGEGYGITADRRVICADCDAAGTPPAPVDSLVTALAGHPATVVRTYQAADRGAAISRLDQETRRLADAGYGLRSQAWAASERPLVTGVFGVGVTLFGLFFVLFVSILVGLVTLLVGIAILAVYAGNIRAATLTATFEALPAGVAAEAPMLSSSGEAHGRSATERLRELAALREQGLLSEEEFAAKRAAVIESL